jgi:hypothetical protein
VITPLVRGLLGLEVDAPAGRLTLAPRLPAEWDSVRVDNLAIGSDRVSFTVKRNGRTLLAEVWRTDGDAARPIDVTFAPAIPLGADGVTMMVPGEPVIDRLPGAVVALSTAKLRERLRLGVSWTGGWEVATDEPAPRIGDRSSAMRVVKERMRDGHYEVTLQGRAGTTHVLRVRGPTDSLAVTRVDPALTPAPTTAPAVGGWIPLRFTLPTQGADDDGYVTITVVM